MTEDQTTFYMVKLSCKGQIRDWQVECEIPETEAEVLKIIDELDDCFTVSRIYRCDYDIAPRDVTEEIRTDAYEAWIAEHDLETEEPPPFIAGLAPGDTGTDHAYDMRKNAA